MLQLWKYRGKKRQAKGFNLREMLTRLSLSELEQARNNSRMWPRASPAATSPPPDHPADAAKPAHQPNVGAGLANSLNLRSTHLPQNRGLDGNGQIHSQERWPQAVGPIGRSSVAEQRDTGHDAWVERTRGDWPPAEPPPHTARYAEEIVSGIARKISARQNGSRPELKGGTIDSAAMKQQLTRRHLDDLYDPEPTEYSEPDMLPESEARGSSVWRERVSDRSKRTPANEAFLQYSKNRILVAAGGGFGIALIATLALLLLHRTPTQTQEPAQRELATNLPKIAREPTTKGAPTPASTASVERDAALIPPPARPVATASTVAPATSLVAGLTSQTQSPAPVSAGRMPAPRLRVADIAAAAGSGEIAFPIGLDAAGGATDNLRVVVGDMPAAARLNHGTRSADGTWKLRPAELAGLHLTMPAQVSSARLTVSLTTAEGIQIARLSPTITIEPQTDLKLSTGKDDPEEKARGLFHQGEARLGSGDVIGARMFFKKAAEAGDAQAANAMGATYDPNLFSSMQVQGMRPDVELARQWYLRAMDLGSKDSLDRLDKLKSR